MCAIGIAGLFLALAKNDIFHGILYSIVPLVEKARTPAAAIYLFHFAIAVLAAFGIDSLFLDTFRPAVRRLMLVLLGFGAILFFIMFAILLGRSMAWPGDDRVMMSVVAAFALAALIYRATRHDTPHTGLLILITALYLIEVGNVTLFALVHKEEKDRNAWLHRYAETTQVADFLKRQPGPSRVWINGDDVSFNFGDWYGIDTVVGYTASMPFNVFQMELHSDRTRMLYGAAYTVSKKALFGGQQEVFRDDKGLAVFKSDYVLPRVWTVHEAVQVIDPPDVRRHLQDPNFDFQRKTFLYSKPPVLQPCDGDRVQSFNRAIDEITIVVNMKCRGMLVMSENNAPGWQATVDGRATPLYDAYTVMRGIVVEPGTHKIETRYRPLSVSAGATASLAAFIAALILWLGPKYRRAKAI